MTSRRLVVGIAALTVLALSPLAAALPVATAADGGHGNSAAPKRLPSAQGTTSPPSTPFVSTATCPEGQRVVSGGYRGPQGADVTASRRTAPDTWTVESPFTQLTAYVTCSSTVSPTAVKVTKAFSRNAQERLVLTPRCPAGKEPVAGGFEYVRDTENSPVFSSHPVAGRGWETRAFENGVDEDEPTNSLSAFAYCAPVETVVRTAEGAEAGEDGKAVAQATCQGSELALGGGYATSPKSDYSNDTGPDFFYFGSLRIGNQSWKVQAANYGQPGTATAYAVCVG